MTNTLSNNSSPLEGIPKDGNYEQISGSSIPAFTHEIKWSPLKIALSSLLFGGFYAVLLAIVFSTGVKILISLTIAIPISLATFIGLLYWYNRNYG